MSLIKNKGSSFYAVLAAHFFELVFCSNLSTLPHVILHEGHSYTKLQNPLSLLAKNNLLPGEKVPLRADQG